MEMSAESEDDEKAQVIPAGVVRAALIRRAVEDIRRIIQIRSSKQALTTLLARGSIGDDLWQRFLRAEKEMEDELRDVVMEVCKIFPKTSIGQNAANIAITGEWHCARLGTSHLPDRKRDSGQHRTQNEAGRDREHLTSGKRVVGAKTSSY